MRKCFFRLWEILWLGQTQMTISIGERPYIWEFTGMFVVLLALASPHLMSVASCLEQLPHWPNSPGGEMSFPGLSSLRVSYPKVSYPEVSPPHVYYPLSSSHPYLSLMSAFERRHLMVSVFRCLPSAVRQDWSGLSSSELLELSFSEPSSPWLSLSELLEPSSPGQAGRFWEGIGFALLQLTFEPFARIAIPGKG